MVISLLICLCGMTMNFVVMINNHGKMPVKGSVYEINYESDWQWMYFQSNEQVEYPLLADQVNIYGRRMFSIGDITMFVGMLILLISGTYNNILTRRFEKIIKTSP